MVGEKICCPGCGCDLELTEDENGTLGCIPFTGPENALLAGYTKMRNGAMVYIGFDGQKYNRADAIAKFGQAEVDLQDEKMKNVEASGGAIKLGRG